MVLRKVNINFNLNLDNIDTIYTEWNVSKSHIDVNIIYKRLQQEVLARSNRFIPINLTNCLFKIGGKIIGYDQKINLDEINNNLIEIDVIVKLKGGFFKEILDGILYFFDKILFDPILYPIQAIFKLIELVFWKIPIYLIKLLIWGLKFIAWFLQDVCNPVMLVNDFGTTISTLIFSFVFAVFDFFKMIIKKIVNTIGPTIFSGFWGWDNVQDSEFDKQQAAYFDPNKSNFKKPQKTYATNDNKIPPTILIGTVIFPPLGVFMEYGLSGWIQIIISGMLTLLFYFPGLIYALLCLYC